MNIKTYKLGDAVSTWSQALALSGPLAKGENAVALLSPDTKFALVAEVVGKDFDDSFLETDINPMTLSVEIGNDGGLVGRFLGYLALTDNKLRFYQALDEDITKRSGDQANVVSHSQSLSLVYEVDIVKLSSQYQGGHYVLTDGVKKFMLINVWPITGTEGHFESKAGGFQAGLKPLFDYINSRGGSLKFSQAPNIFAVAIIVIIIAFAAFLFLAKSHSG